MIHQCMTRWFHIRHWILLPHLSPFCRRHLSVHNTIPHTSVDRSPSFFTILCRHDPSVHDMLIPYPSLDLSPSFFTILCRHDPSVHDTLMPHPSLDPAPSFFTPLHRVFVSVWIIYHGPGLKSTPPPSSTRLEPVLCWTAQCMGYRCTHGLCNAGRAISCV